MDQRHSGAAVFGSSVFSQGKHRGRCFSEVRASDPSYCNWALKLDRPWGDMAKFVEFLHMARMLPVIPHAVCDGQAPLQVASCSWPHSLTQGTNSALQSILHQPVYEHQACLKVSPCAWPTSRMQRGNSIGQPIPQQAMCEGQGRLPVASCTWPNSRIHVANSTRQPMSQQPMSEDQARRQVESCTWPTSRMHGATSTGQRMSHGPVRYGCDTNWFASLPVCAQGTPAPFASATPTEHLRDRKNEQLDRTASAFLCFSSQDPARHTAQPMDDSSSSPSKRANHIWQSREDLDQQNTDVAKPVPSQDPAMLPIASEIETATDLFFGHHAECTDNLMNSSAEDDAAKDYFNKANEPFLESSKSCKRSWLSCAETDTQEDNASFSEIVGPLRISDPQEFLFQSSRPPATPMQSSEGLKRAKALAGGSGSKLLMKKRRRRVIASGSESDTGKSFDGDGIENVSKLGGSAQQDATPNGSATSALCTAQVRSNQNEGTQADLHSVKRGRVQCNPMGDSSSGDDDENMSDGTRRVREDECMPQVPRDTTYAREVLRNISAAAKETVITELAGPSKNSGLPPQHCVDTVLQSMTKGCTNLTRHFWEFPGGLSSKSKSFADLKEHQAVGVRWLLALQDRVPGMILADEMGLGKTLQVLCFLEVLASKTCSLIVAPASLLGNWEAEAKKWTPDLRLLKYHSSSTNGRLSIRSAFIEGQSEYKLLLTTPQSLHCKDDQQFFRRITFDCLIVDEAHLFKNGKTSRYREWIKLIQCRRRVLLTGTPIQNSITELATLLKFALHSKDEAGSAVGRHLQQIADEPQEQALDQLQALVAPFILRRSKADVLTTLPPKRGIVVYCEMTSVQQDMYSKEVTANKKTASLTKRHVKDAFHNLRRICLHPLLGRWRLSDGQVSMFADQFVAKRSDFRTVSRARVMKEITSWSDFEKHQAAVDLELGPEFRVSDEELLNSAKMQQLLNILQQQENNGDKTLVFSQFTQLLDIVESVLRIRHISFQRLDGNTPVEARQAMAEAFQRPGGPLTFLISMKAGGVGLNLTAANSVVMLDLDFNPQNMRQAEDRVHRLGQTREVVIYYLVCRGTVEEMVLKRAVSKLELDQQFGARCGVLENAVARAQISGEHALHEEETGSEEQVIEELHELLCQAQQTCLSDGAIICSKAS